MNAVLSNIAYDTVQAECHTISILLDNLITKSFCANIGHHKSNFCVQRFLLIWCNKIKKSDLRQEKRQLYQLKNSSPKVGSIWLFRKINSTDLVNNKKY